MKAIQHLLLLGAVFLGGTFTASANPPDRQPPKEGDGLKVTVKPGRDAVVADQDQRVVVKIEISGPKGKPAKRLPLNLAVVIDRSGSMRGVKIEQAKQAAVELLEQLQPQDSIALVAYDEDVKVLIPAQKVEEKKVLRRKIESIRVGGSTALHAGVQEGGKQLGRYLKERNINRVLLLSDGLANVGPSSNQEIAKLGRELARQGKSVTTIGLGADYNEDLMAALAEASDANYYYVQDIEKLPGIFREELGELMAVTARQVEIVITAADGVKPLRLIGRDETFSDGKATVKFGPMSSGQTRYLLLECEVPAGTAGLRKKVAHVKVAYEHVGSEEMRDASGGTEVAYTDSQEEADASVNRDVQADVQLQLTALAKKKAISEADKGNHRLAGSQLREQAAALRAGAPSAPAAQRKEMLQEANDLSTFADQVVEEGAMSKQNRKALQKGYYDKRNSKK